MPESIQNVLSFSGGKTSGYMLHREIERIGIDEYNRRFITVFENTGKEHDKTLDFVHDVETKWGVNVIWLEYCRIPAVDIDPLLIPEGRKRKNLCDQVSHNESAHWFRRVRWETAARYYDSKTPFDELLEWARVLPNLRSRMCSVQMKIRTRDRFLYANGVRSFRAYIGIRNDEAHRKTEILANIGKEESPVFPLIDDSKTLLDVERFWSQQSFTLGIKNFEGNCRECFLKARWKRVAVARLEPEAIKWWIDKEDQFAIKADGDGRFFRKGQSFTGILSDAMHPEFNFMDSDDEDVPCSCAVGGYRGNNEDEL